jgi:hypothetical protein
VPLGCTGVGSTRGAGRAPAPLGCGGPIAPRRVAEGRVAEGGALHTYVAYGARIESYLPLPPLVAGEGGEPLVRVRRADLRDLPFEALSGFQTHVAPGQIWIRHSEVGTFLARDGREIVVDPVPGVEERVIRSYVVKAALAAVLLQQGKLILHASAAAIRGVAVAFVAESGMGKSTTSAALHTRGHAVLADDLVGVDVCGANTPMALPGFPQVLLLPESATAIGRDPSTLPRSSPRSDKYTLDAPQGFPLEPLPLVRVYALADADRITVEPLSGQEAVATLIAHTFGLFAFGQGAQPAHFLLCAELAKRVPVRRLARARRLAALDELARVVEDDLAGDG